MSGNGVRKDVLIKAPAAVWTDPGQSMAIENRMLRSRIRELEVTARTVANIAISLATMYTERTNEEAVVPKWLHERMEGASISIGELPNGDVKITHRERSIVPVYMEEV